MENKPSLSQYFGGSDVPPASQFFDEIGSSPSDNPMIQSIYLGESEVTQPPATITQASGFSLQQQDDPFVLPTVSGPFTGPHSAVPAASLPDPSTFFDTIGPEPPMSSKSKLPPPPMTEVVDGLNAKQNQPVDKEADRRRDAWIPNEEAKKTLIKAQSSPKGSFFPEREVLTMPGIVLEEELADALHSVAVQYLGVSSAGSRNAVRADHVARDEPGLRELLRAGCFRAAANLAAVNLTAAGQAMWPGTSLGCGGYRYYLPAGVNLTVVLDAVNMIVAGQCPGRMHRPTKHTPRSLQLWLTRFAVMIRIKLHEPLVKEAEPFGDLSKPDMFYQFYPDTYGDRTGSIAPFSLRLLIAELPGHVGKHEEAMDRLYAMLDVINQMLSNLQMGKTEDGSGTLTSEQDKIESIRLWTGRHTRVQHSIVNCAIALKDYRLASNILISLKEEASSPMQKRAIASALCRLHLLAGNIRAANIHVEDAKQHRLHLCPTPDVREYIDLGLIDIAMGKYQDAYNNFLRAADQEPTNIMVANNLAVCLLYMGRLKEAIAVLQKAIHSDPERGLNESLLTNLCTLYELESSNTQEKKLNLLRMLCKHKSDTIPNVAECLKLS